MKVSKIEQDCRVFEKNMAKNERGKNNDWGANCKDREK